MNLSRLRKQTGLGLSAFCFITTAQAGIPLWSIIPNGSPEVSVSATGTATVQYTVSNNSKKAHRLTLSAKTPKGIGQSGPCILGPKGAMNSTCTLTLTINGSALPSNTVSGGPILCQTNANRTPNPNQCYQPSPGNTLVITRTTAPGATTLSTSILPPSILALSVKSTSVNAALTGNARQITIKNTGANEAIGVSVSATGLPTGTDITTVPTTCTGTLAANATCTVTITPGPNATSGCNAGTAPTSGAITVSATNVATAATTNVVVLSYGCQYQGGFLFSVDDSYTDYPISGSIGGKVVSLVDQAAPYISSSTYPGPGIIWSSNGNGNTNAEVSYDIIPGIADTQNTPAVDYSYFEAWYNGVSPFSTPSYLSSLTIIPQCSSTVTTGCLKACTGTTDGSCDTDNLIAFYNYYHTNYPGSPTAPVLGTTPLTDYAAGLCRPTSGINGYSDWYLPSICEMGPDSGNGICSTTTVEQNMVDSLSFLLGDPNATTNPTPSTSCNQPDGPPSGTDCLAGGYWSSTEYSGYPLNFAWFEYFASVSSGGSYQDYGNKYRQFGVRCLRALTL